MSMCRGAARSENPGSCALILDGHALFATSLRMALRAQGLPARPILTTSQAAILAAAEELPSGVAVLDLDMRDVHGHPIVTPDLIGGLVGRTWRVVVTSDGIDGARVAAAVAAGAAASVPKTEPVEVLIDTVCALAVGEDVMTPSERSTSDRRQQARASARRFEHLTLSERGVLRLLAEGNRAGDIAAVNGAPVTSVRTQIRAIIAKLGVSSQLEAVALLFDQRIHLDSLIRIGQGPDDGMRDHPC